MQITGVHCGLSIVDVSCVNSTVADVINCAGKLLLISLVSSDLSLARQYLPEISVKNLASPEVKPYDLPRRLILSSLGAYRVLVLGLTKLLDLYKSKRLI